MKKININELKKLNVAEAMTYLKTTNEGLSSSIIATRRLDYGNNEMPKAKKDNKFITITKAIFNPFNLILLGLAVISLFTDIIYAKEKDYTTMAIILTMVSLSTLIKIIQDFKAERAFSNLAKLIENKVRVRRDGKEVTIPLSELVIGDYLILSVGEIVPADIRIVDSNQFYVDESSLTGESEPIFKNNIPTEETDLLKASNIAFMGSLVKSGSAEGLVCQLCKDTYYGQIASSLQQKKKLTSFDKGIRKVSHLLVGFMLIMVPIVFIINGFTTSNWLGAFLFAIAIAVGLTPEMLPMIVTTCLAKGSVEMGHKKTIIKDMNAIQNLGAMDILCTDKTGTLTNNQMEVIDTLNVLGESDKKVLLYASLNSYYQTGYQNPLDVAIMAAHPQEKFTKVGELPYDFERRMLSIVGYYDAKLLVITKGAVHEILTKSSSYLVAGKVKPMTNDLLFQLEKRNVSWLNEGKRVLAVAIKEDLNTTNFTYSDETNLCLVGFITLSDEPKPSAYKTIKALKEHGVSVKILTGDSVQNTSYICRQIGLGEVKAIDGLTLSKWSEEKLAKSSRMVQEAELYKYVTDGDMSSDEKVLSGSDIIRFISKNTTLYNYRIYFSDTDFIDIYPDCDAQMDAKDLILESMGYETAAEKASVDNDLYYTALMSLWSQAYLSNYIFEEKVYGYYKPYVTYGDEITQDIDMIIDNYTQMTFNFKMITD